MLPGAFRAVEFESSLSASSSFSRRKIGRESAATSMVLDGLEFDLSNLSFPLSSKKAGVADENRNDTSDSSFGDHNKSRSSTRSRETCFGKVGHYRDDAEKLQNYAVFQENFYSLPSNESEASLGGGEGKTSTARPLRTPLFRLRGKPISYPPVSDIPSSLDTEEIFQKNIQDNNAIVGWKDNVTPPQNPDKDSMSASIAPTTSGSFSREEEKEHTAVSNVPKIGYSKATFLGNGRCMDERRSKVGFRDSDYFYVRHCPPPPESYSAGGRLDTTQNNLPQPQTCSDRNYPHRDSDHSPPSYTMGPEEETTPPKVRLETRSHIWLELFAECGILDRSQDEFGDELDDDHCNFDSTTHNSGGASSPLLPSLKNYVDPCLPAAPSHRHWSPSHRQRRGTNTTFNHEERPLVEVSPGIFVPLRASLETRHAVRERNSIHTRCESCNCQLLCIADVDMFMCPECRTIATVDHPQEGGGGGLGIGITEEEAAKEMKHFNNRESRV
jgi:hypothetical protein